MPHKITTRQYTAHDAQALANIYYYTIHKVNIRDYSIEQVNAWAPSSSLELVGWKDFQVNSIKHKRVLSLVFLYNQLCNGWFILTLSNKVVYT